MLIRYAFVLSCVLLAGNVLAAEETAASEVQFEKRVLADRYYCDGITTGDINGDGKPDIIAGPFWYQGPDFQQAHAFYKPIPLPLADSPSNSMFSFVDDFNHDGQTDILVLGRVHKHVAKWYENPGSDTNSSENTKQISDQQRALGRWKSHDVFERVKGESPTMCDITGSGKPQLMCHWEGRWGWIQPVLDPFARWKFHAVTSNVEDWPQFYHGQGVGDVNGDGLPDLLLNDGWIQQPARSDQTAHAVDAKDPTWQFHRGRFSDLRGGAQMFAYDVDGDGDQDVITAKHAHEWGLAWYEQLRGEDGKVHFREHLIMGDRQQEAEFGIAFSQPHAMTLADIDGDGLQDIVTGKRRWAHGPAGDVEPNAEPIVCWFQLTRDQNGVRYVPHIIDRESGVGVQVHATDVNGDGRTDVLTASKLGTFLFLNRGKQTRTGD